MYTCLLIASSVEAVCKFVIFSNGLSIKKKDYSHRVAPTVGALQRSFRFAGEDMPGHALFFWRILVAFWALKDKDMKESLMLN